MRLPQLAALGLGLASSILTGCATSGDGIFGGSTASTPATATAITGTISAGKLPVSQSHVYLMAVNSTGYGQPSVSLLQSSATGHFDDVGAYVLTDSNGNFSMPSGYTCTGTTQVYVYAVGGGSGSLGLNSGAGFLGAIGDCPMLAFGEKPNVILNEISTVATAYAIAGFATDATHISSSATSLAHIGLVNAFLNIANLASDGAALYKTPAGNGFVPQQTINVIADILHACNATNGPNSAPCSTLFANARSAGATGNIPSDTATAAIYLAHFPGAATAALYPLAAIAPPYAPMLAAAPNDFSLGINFTGAGISGPYAVAIDASGDAWFANLGNSSISKLSSNGTPLSPAVGFNNGTPIGPVGISIDPSGNAWIVGAISGNLTEYSPSGALLSPMRGYVGGGISLPQAIASDANGNIWVANYTNSASEFSNGGIAISPPYGYTGGGLGGAVGVAIDAQGTVWLPNTSTTPNSITRLSKVGAPISPVTGYVGGGIANPFAIAIDSAGAAWVANYGSNSVTKLDSSGNILSGTNGFTGGGLSLPFSIAADGGGNVWVANSGDFSVSEFASDGTALSPLGGYTGGALNSPEAIAVDGSGNVWIANTDDITVTELIGMSIPVITPLSMGVRNNTIANRP